jgi:uracil-DNA glycosylase family 4
MPELIEEFKRILNARKAAGNETVWLSEQNRNLLHAAIPAKRVTAPPVPCTLHPAPRTPHPAPCTLHPAVSVDNCDWEELHQVMLSCQACPLAQGRKTVVCGNGCPQARLMFIGEGPGEEEDKQGVAFVGRAGHMLTNMILAMGFDRNSNAPEKAVYIANIVKCRPPGNRNPSEQEAAACLPYLRRQIELVKPQAIVLLGAVALRFLLGKTGITQRRGTWLEYQGIPVMPTFHPAYLLRFEGQKTLFVSEKRKVWNDLQQVMHYLKQSSPSN